MPYSPNSMDPIVSSVPTSLPLVGIIMLSLCLFDKLFITPNTSETIDLVCTLKQAWVLYDESNHQCIIDIYSTLRLNFICSPPFKYFRNLFNFTQSSSSTLLTILVMKPTSALMYHMYLADTKSIFATVWWNIYYCYSGRNCFHIRPWSETGGHYLVLQRCHIIFLGMMRVSYSSLWSYIPFL